MNVKLNVTENSRIIKLVLSGTGVRGASGTSGLTADELAAVNGAASPDADNVFATIADVEAGVAGVASFEGRTGAVTATAGDYQASEITVDASGFDGNLAVTDNTVQKVAQKVDDLVAGAGSGDLSDGDTLTTGLTFPVAGLHILDTNATHDLILSPGSNLTGDRTLTLTTGDSDRTLTIGASASVAGTNTGDQDLSGYCLKSIYDANTIVAANVDNTPVALTVAEQTLVGRITGGSIDDLSPTQVRTLLNVADGAVAAGTAGDAYAVSHEADTTAHAASSIVNTPAGDIIATTVQAAINELDTEKAAVSHTQAEASITFTDINTGNSTVLAHGFLPKLSGVTEQYFNGNGGWTTPSGSGSGTGSGLVIVEASSIGGSMTCQFTENTSF